MSQTIGDIFGDRHMREQRVVLEKQTHIALVGPQAAHIAPANRNRSVVRLFEARDQTQDRRLAATAGSEQRHGFSGRHRKRDIGNRRNRAEPLRHAAEFYRRGHRGP